MFKEIKNWFRKRRKYFIQLAQPFAILMREKIDWCYIQKGSKLLMCTLIRLLKQYFLLLMTFCTYFERCSNFEFEVVWRINVIVSQCKWVSGVDTYEAYIAADSIIWELFARKSAECLNLPNSFITISIAPKIQIQIPNPKKISGMWIMDIKFL